MGAGDFERPFSMRGLTAKIKTPHGSMFVTINFFEGQVKEVFVVVSKPGSELRACAEALGRVISLALQKGVPAEGIIETLENIKTEEVVWNRFDSRSFTVSSIPDGIAKALRFATSLKFTPDSFRETNERKKTSEPNQELKKQKNTETKKELKNGGRESKMDICPNCHSSSLVFQEGCFICMNCGYTKCS